MATAEAGLFEVALDVDGDAMQVLVLYPSLTPALEIRRGPYTFDAAVEGEWLPGPHPVVVLSHGSGGAPLTHRGLALHLARAGFVVLMPEHPGNNRNDNRLRGTATLLAHRPRQVRALLEWASTAPALVAHVDLSRIGVVGHSMGGYTGLALAGGRPMAFPEETPDGRPRRVEVVPDPRVAALVLLAPAAAWFMQPAALADVAVPILMLTGELDTQTPPFHARLIIDGAAAEVTHREIPGAAHYSFLAPFPPEMGTLTFLPAQDPPGFDRVAFHAELYPEIEAFLTQHLHRRASSRRATATHDAR